MTPGNQGVQAWNRYAYVNNNPVLLGDPSGHCAICILFPIIQGIAQNVTAATRQAISLVGQWAFEVGPQFQTFGPNEPLTQEVMNDPGMDEFREKWAESGNQVPFSWEHKIDGRSGSISDILGGITGFVRENAELGLSMLGLGSQDAKGSIDAVGGVLGSLDKISVTSSENGQVQFEVTNTMGWSSATRIPGTNISIIHNRDRNEPGPGGTIIQYFTWYEQYSDQ